VCVFSVCCKKTYDSKLEDGAPIILDNYPEHRAGDGNLHNNFMIDSTM